MRGKENKERGRKSRKQRDRETVDLSIKTDEALAERSDLRVFSGMVSAITPFTHSQSKKLVLSPLTCGYTFTKIHKSLSSPKAHRCEEM